MHLSRTRSSRRGLAAVLLLAGCQAAASGEGSGAPAPGPPPADPRPAAVTSPAADSLRLRLDVPAGVRAGAPVPIVLRVENVSPRPVELYLRGRTIAFDVVVARADGGVVWRRLEDEVIPAVVQVRALAPNETLELRAEWDQRTARGAAVPAGEYVARGLLLTDRPEPLETPPVPLRIVAASR